MKIYDVILIINWSLEISSEARWRDGRVVDGGSLENYYTRKRIGGSNPPPSD